MAIDKDNKLYETLNLFYELLKILFYLLQFQVLNTEKSN